MELLKSELKDNIINKNMTFEEVYNYITDNRKFNYATYLYTNNELKKKKILTKEEYKILFELIKSDDEESVKFISKNKCNNIEEKKELLSALLNRNTKRLHNLINDYESLIYIIENVKKTNCNISLAYYVGRDYNSIENTWIKRNIFESMCRNSDFIEEILIYQPLHKYDGNELIFNDIELKVIYNLHKNNLFTNRKGAEKLNKYCTLFSKWIEYKYVKMFSDKLIRTNNTKYSEQLIQSLRKLNLTDEEYDTIMAGQMMLRIAS